MRTFVAACAVISCTAIAACSAADASDTAPSADAGVDSPASQADAGPDAAEPAEFTAPELAAIAKLSPLPAVPPDPTNAYADNAAAAALGQRLFFDKSYSGPLVVGNDGTDG